MGIICRGVPLPQDTQLFVCVKEAGVSVYRRYKIWGRGKGGERQPNNGWASPDKLARLVCWDGGGEDRYTASRNIVNISSTIRISITDRPSMVPDGMDLALELRDRLRMGVF